MSERDGSAPLASARGVEYAYESGPRALAGVDVEVRAGELAVAIGPNGSGKSTLLKVLAGLVEPDRGDVELDGAPLSRWSPRERARRVALVPQFLPALPEVRVVDFVLSGRYARLARGGVATKTDHDAVRAALEQCDAHELAERSMTELSGGQRQRVLIARAVAQEAALLLVDEPTNALDPEHQVLVFELLARLVAHERAALVVTHDLNLASQFATRLVLLDAGRVVIDGPPRDVLARAVLEPVYGAQLYFGTWPHSGRPYVLPSRGTC